MILTNLTEEKKEKYLQLYSQIHSVQDWMDLLEDDTLNYYELTESLSNYKKNTRGFWKIAEIGGDWEFDINNLPDAMYRAEDMVNDNMVGSEKEVLEKSGYAYGYNRHGTEDITQRIVDAMALENINAVINVQPPGGVKNVHIDTLTCFYNHTSTDDFSKIEFDLATRQPKNYPSLYRILVALTDWQPGWMFQLGEDSWTGWKKGDVITFDWANIPHCTANASFFQRPLLKITASGKDDWITKCIQTGEVKKIIV